MRPARAIASKLLVVSAAVLLLAATCEPEPPREEQPTRANGLIAFVREGRVHTLDPRTGATAALTEDLLAGGLSWSPDGERIAFQVESAGPGLALMKAEGGTPRNLTNRLKFEDEFCCFGFSRPTWSPDGTQMAFSAYLLSTEDECGHLPPGSKEPHPLCFRSYLYVLDLDGGGLRQLTKGLFMDLDPVWSPDGSKIAFVRIDYTKIETQQVETQQKGFDLLVVDPEGGAPRSLSPPNPAYAGGLAWSPGGERLLFQDHGSHIFVMEVASAQITPLVRARTQTELYEPSWAPDGKSVLFTRRVDGAEAVFIIDAEGGHERRLVEGCCASWQPVTLQSK